MFQFLCSINRAVEDEDGSQEESLEEQAPEPPIPAPRTNLYRKKVFNGTSVISCIQI